MLSRIALLVILLRPRARDIDQPLRRRSASQLKLSLVKLPPLEALPCEATPLEALPCEATLLGTSLTRSNERR
jgi:hypothetical protein